MYEYDDDLFAPISCAVNNADFLPENVSEIAAATPLFVFPSSSWLPNFPPSAPNYELSTGRSYNDFDSVNNEAIAALKLEVDEYSTNMNCSSSSSSVYGSTPSCYVQQRPSLIQRSMSTGDSLLQKNGILQDPNFLCSLEEFYHDNLNLETGPMRKVFSTGDIQKTSTTQRNRSESTPLMHENCIGEGTKKVGRYSAEERKERIERYRSKRNQRNFSKKIKYACRKTLADSRPRIRGRFMRNEESGDPISSQTQWNQIGVDYEDDEAWINFLDALSVNQIIP